MTDREPLDTLGDLLGVPVLGVERRADGSYVIRLAEGRRALRLPRGRVAGYKPRTSYVTARDGAPANVSPSGAWRCASSSPCPRARLSCGACFGRGPRRGRRAAHRDHPGRPGDGLDDVADL